MVIGSVGWLIIFKLLNAADAGAANVVINVLNTSGLYVVGGVFGVAICGSLLAKSFFKKESEHRKRVERRLDYFWVVSGSVTYGAIFIKDAIAGDYFKLVLAVSILVVPALYEIWDKFVDRYADFPNQK